MASSAIGLIFEAMPAQPKASKRALTRPRAAFLAAASALRGSNSLGLLGKDLAHGAGHGQADVGVDVDLAHAALDAALDFFHRHAVGFLDVAAVLADDGQPLLRHAARAVHHQVGVGDLRMDGRDAVDGQDVAGGLAGELVGAVAGADGNGQRVDTGLAPRSPWPAPGRSASCRGVSLPSAPTPSSSPASPVSSEPRQPSSPSTDTPTACAISQTRRVMSTL